MHKVSSKMVPSERMPSSYYIVLTFIIPPMLWAGNYIVGRVVRDDISPVTLTFLRWVVALVVIFPFAFSHFKRDFKSYLQYPLRIIAVSLSGIAVFSVLVYYGLHYTSGTNALLLNSCAPVLIMIFASIFFGAKLRMVQVLGLFVSCFGVIVIIFKGDVSGLYGLEFSSGDLLLLGAMACFAFYTLWLRKIPAEINRLGLLGIQIVVTLIALFPFVMHEQYSGVSANWNQRTISAIIFLGVFPSFVSYLFYSRCVEIIGAARASLSIHLIPVFGVAFSILFLGESVHLFHLAGISTILAGVSLASNTLTGDKV